jgi:hypothetical protein
MTLEKTCLHRINGECKSCLIDYSPNHHPNNYDCRDYVDVDIVVIKIENPALPLKNTKRGYHSERHN